MTSYVVEIRARDTRSSERSLVIKSAAKKVILQVCPGPQCAERIRLSPRRDKLMRRQIFCQCHANSRRYGIIHNWDAAQVVELRRNDCMVLSPVIERQAGRDENAFTLMSALVILALKIWSVRTRPPTPRPHQRLNPS